MSVFTLSQMRDTITTRYEVDADGSVATQLSPYPASNANYLCVNNASENSYVYNSTPSLLLDLYSIVTADLPADDINWIRITVNAKSQDSRPASDATYKIIHSIDGGATIEESTNIDLITAYNNYYWVLWANPSTSSPWTYEDLCDLEIGVECSSPTRAVVEYTETFQPTGDGDLQNLAPYDDRNWRRLRLDEWGPYVGWVYNSDFYTTKESSFTIDTFTGSEATMAITKVVIFMKSCTDAPDYSTNAYPFIRMSGVNYNGSWHYNPINYGWTTYSDTWELNPATGLAWTKDDINTIQIGAGISHAWSQPIPDSHGCVDFLYMVVYYATVTNPALKTNHIYLDVNYDEDDSTCTLTSPTDIEAYHSRDSNAINFWNGDREVYDICRSGKGIMLSGDEYEGDEEHSSTPCERITCIRDMGRDGNLVEISGLGTLYDGTYRIKSFGWNKISEQPEYYTWQLELEVED